MDNSHLYRAFWLNNLKFHHFVYSFNQFNRISTSPQISAECIVLDCILFDVHFVLLTVIFGHCHFAYYRVVLKLQNISSFKAKRLLFAVYTCITMRKDEPVLTGTVMSVSNIGPTPIFKLMLRCLSYLADTNTYPYFECVDTHCPFVFSVFSCCFTDTVC